MDGNQLTKPNDSASGMSIREHFAAIALQGFLAYGGRNKTPMDWLAKDAVKAADELIKALNKDT